MSSTLNVGIDSQVWIASGAGSIASGSPLFAGAYAVTVNDALGAPVGAGAGAYAGFFTDLAAAAGLSFSLTSGGTTISGAAGFERIPGGP